MHFVELVIWSANISDFRLNNFLICFCNLKKHKNYKLFCRIEQNKTNWNYNSSSLPGKKNILSGDSHHSSRTLIRGMVLLNGDGARHLLENTYLHLIRKSRFLYSLKTFICIQWRREFTLDHSGEMPYSDTDPVSWSRHCYWQ